MEQNQTASKFHIGLAMFLLYTVWGSTYLAIRYTVVTFPPFLMGALRFLMAGVILYIFLRARGVSAPEKSHWKSALIIGALLLGGGNGGVVWAEKNVSSGLTALLVSVVPLWIAVVDALRPGGRRPSALTTIGLLLGFAGLILLIGPESLSGPIHLSAPLAALIVSPMMWSLGSVYSKHTPLPASPFMSTAIEMIAGGAVMLALSCLFGELNGFSFASVSRVAWVGFYYLVFIGALVGFTAYIYLLKNVSLPIASTYAYVNPVVAVILGWLIADESLTGRSIAAGALVLAAVALITFQENKTPSA